LPANQNHQMPKKYKNRYRIQSHRKPGWDYSAPGQYFITFVVQKHRCILGHIHNDEMIYNDWGKIILTEWLKSFEIRNELFCDIFQIMPNHLHAIITIIPAAGRGNDGVQPHGRVALQENPGEINPHSKKNHPIRKPKSISSFIAGFKSATNTEIDNAIDAGINLFPEFGKFNRNNHFWQPNYHDHIIRNESSYNRIFNYIKSNPKNWKNDSLKNSGK